VLLQELSIPEERLPVNGVGVPFHVSRVQTITRLADTARSLATCIPHHHVNPLEARVEHRKVNHEILSQVAKEAAAGSTVTFQYLITVLVLLYCI
jgi:hypothetical protein